MSFMEFNEITRLGCVCCQRELSWEERDEVYWASPDTPICSECSTDTKLAGLFFMTLQKGETTYVN